MLSVSLSVLTFWAASRCHASAWCGAASAPSPSCLCLSPGAPTRKAAANERVPRSKQDCWTRVLLCWPAGPGHALTYNTHATHDKKSCQEQLIRGLCSQTPPSTTAMLCRAHHAGCHSSWACCAQVLIGVLTMLPLVISCVASAPQRVALPRLCAPCCCPGPSVPNVGRLSACWPSWP